VDFFGRLFGGKEAAVARALSAAETFVREVEQLAGYDTKSAVGKIKNRPNRIEPLLDFGGPLHVRFTDVVLATLYRTKTDNDGSGVKLTYTDLPSVIVISDEEISTLGRAIDAAADSERDLVCVRHLDGWRLDVVRDIELLYEFAVDPRVLLIIHGGPDDVVAGREFFLTASERFHRDGRIADAATALARFAENQPGVTHVDCFETVYGYAPEKFLR